MKIKAIGKILVASILLMGPVYAQEQQVADEVIQRMTAALALTPSQVIAIKPIIVDNIAKRQALYNGAKDKAAIKDQLDQSLQAETQALRDVLDPGQLDKFNSLTEQEQILHGRRGLQLDPVEKK